MAWEEALRTLLPLRQNRLRAEMRRLNVPALLTNNPIDILYATGVQNMTLFGLMSGSRFMLLFADGPCILYEYYGCLHLAQGYETVDLLREAPGLSHTSAGDGIYDAAARFAAELADDARREMPGESLLAIDRFPVHMADALRTAGFTLIDSAKIFAEARRRKLPEEVLFIREAVARTEAAVAQFEAAIEPGRSEAEVWAEFIAPLIAAEGQYVSTRLMQAGPNTFPYFQESGNRPMRKGELVCLDTDTIGFHGYAVDFSRSFLCGIDRGNGVQRDLYAKAKDQLDHNVDLFRAGRTYRDIAEAAWPVPEEYRATGYYCIAHGLGMSGEYPNVPHFHAADPYPLPGEVEEGMVLCVESYVGDAATGQGVKLEDQLLITANGPERLSGYRFSDALM